MRRGKEGVNAIEHDGLTCIPRGTCHRKPLICTITIHLSKRRRDMLQSRQSTNSITIKGLQQMLLLRNRNLGERKGMCPKTASLKLAKETLMF